MKTLARLVSISILLTGAFGCSAGSSEKVAADARAQAGSENTGAFNAPQARLVIPSGTRFDGVVLATKGKEIHCGPETCLNFTLANSVQM
jgi:hypothetical protein